MNGITENRFAITCFQTTRIDGRRSSGLAEAFRHLHCFWGALLIFRAITGWKPMPLVLSSSAGVFQHFECFG